MSVNWFSKGFHIDCLFFLNVSWTTLALHPLLRWLFTTHFLFLSKTLDRTVFWGVFRELLQTSVHINLSTSFCYLMLEQSLVFYIHLYIDILKAQPNKVIFILFLCFEVSKHTHTHTNCDVFPQVCFHWLVTFISSVVFVTASPLSVISEQWMFFILSHSLYRKWDCQSFVSVFWTNLQKYK